MNHGKAPDTQASSAQANPRRGMSLRAKGFWMLVFFVVFTFLTGLVVVREHAELYSNMQQLQALHMEEEYQIGLNMHVANVVLTLNSNVYNQDMARTAHLVSQEIEAVNSGLQVAAQFRPGLADNVTDAENVHGLSLIIEVRSKEVRSQKKYCRFCRLLLTSGFSLLTSRF